MGVEGSGFSFGTGFDDPKLVWKKKQNKMKNKKWKKKNKCKKSRGEKKKKNGKERSDQSHVSEDTFISISRVTFQRILLFRSPESRFRGYFCFVLQSHVSKDTSVSFSRVTFQTILLFRSPESLIYLDDGGDKIL